MAVTNPVIDDHVELRLVETPEQAYLPPRPDAQPVLATASRAVPLLWLGLFDYEEAEVRQSGKLQVFAATTPVAKAKKRAEALAEALPETPQVLREMARILAEALAQAPRDQHLALYPESVFYTLAQAAARPYLELLFDLCSLWQRVRQGQPWDKTKKELDRLVPDLSRVLTEQDPRRAGYYLGGSLAEQLGSLERYRLRQGQGEKDLEPEALVVGEAGLLLGRFGGEWKLMTSRTNHDLLGVWGETGAAFIVGRHGTVLRLKKGRCSLEEIPTKTHLNGVWGLNPRFVCAVGDGGLLLAYDGRSVGS